MLLLSLFFREDRSGRITMHYSAAELSRLIEAAEVVTDRCGKRPELVILPSARPAKLPHGSRLIQIPNL